jgi:thymidylate synthase (FAD)
MKLPAFVPDVHRTAAGTPYLKGPGVALVAMPRFLPMEATHFVNSFGNTFDAADYENDWFVAPVDRGVVDDDSNLKVDDGVALCKFAGQTCYLSFGEKRTRNDPEGIKKYFDNIRSSGHGSVLEHANYSMIVWGVDRAFSHEMVRHRAGWAFSQLSQRYVDGRTLRFVERPEYQDDPDLHERFERWIDAASDEYDRRAIALSTKMRDTLAKMPSTERRKAVNQAARNCLPNETETAMVLTGNIRAWWHVLEMRASPHADLPISRVMLCAHEILSAVSPVLFGDYEVMKAGDRDYLLNDHRKV